MRNQSVGLAALTLSTLLTSTPASAHHAIGGATPSNGWEGLLSGLAHPVLGLDHLAFIVAAGMIAALHRRGVFVPIAFVAASLAGTGIRFLAFDLPGSGWMIATSIVLIGALLATGRESLGLVIPLVSAAGILHGYAYGQSIVGAEMTPLWSYLLGLAIVQLIIGLSTERISRIALRPAPALRWAGLVVCGIGIAYLSTQSLG